jgi:hypothetical protein
MRCGAKIAPLRHDAVRSNTNRRQIVDLYVLAKDTELADLQIPWLPNLDSINDEAAFSNPCSKQTKQAYAQATQDSRSAGQERNLYTRPQSPL